MGKPATFFVLLVVVVNMRSFEAKAIGDISGQLPEGQQQDHDYAYGEPSYDYDGSIARGCWGDLSLTYNDIPQEEGEKEDRKEDHTHKDEGKKPGHVKFEPYDYMKDENQDDGLYGDLGTAYNDKILVRLANQIFRENNQKIENKKDYSPQQKGTELHQFTWTPHTVPDDVPSTVPGDEYDYDFPDFDYTDLKSPRRSPSPRPKRLTAGDDSEELFTYQLHKKETDYFYDSSYHDSDYYYDYNLPSSKDESEAVKEEGPSYQDKENEPNSSTRDLHAVLDEEYNYDYTFGDLTFDYDSLTLTGSKDTPEEKDNESAQTYPQKSPKVTWAPHTVLDDKYDYDYTYGDLEIDYDYLTLTSSKDESEAVKEEGQSYQDKGNEPNSSTWDLHAVLDDKYNYDYTYGDLTFDYDFLIPSGSNDMPEKEEKAREANQTHREESQNSTWEIHAELDSKYDYDYATSPRSNDTPPEQEEKEEAREEKQIQEKGPQESTWKPHAVLDNIYDYDYTYGDLDIDYNYKTSPRSNDTPPEQEEKEAAKEDKQIQQKEPQESTWKPHAVLDNIYDYDYTYGDLDIDYNYKTSQSSNDTPKEEDKEAKQTYRKESPKGTWAPHAVLDDNYESPKGTWAPDAVLDDSYESPKGTWAPHAVLDDNYESPKGTWAPHAVLDDNYESPKGTWAPHAVLDDNYESPKGTWAPDAVLDDNYDYEYTYGDLYIDYSYPTSNDKPEDEASENTPHTPTQRTGVHNRTWAPHAVLDNIYDYDYTYGDLEIDYDFTVSPRNVSQKDDALPAAWRMPRIPTGTPQRQRNSSQRQSLSKDVD